MKILTFSEHLKEALTENELTQREIAEKIGTTQQTISRWLKGINEPDLETLLHLCFILRETPNSILGYDDLTEADIWLYLHDEETIEEAKANALVAKYEEKGNPVNMYEFDDEDDDGDESDN